MSYLIYQYVTKIVPPGPIVDTKFWLKGEADSGFTTVRDTIGKINFTIGEAVENIDIGGVTLLRAAAKNHARVCVLSDPQDYAEFLKGLDKGEITEKSRQLYAVKSFERTAGYESAIADFFRKKYASDGTSQLSLRYGANPHQTPAAIFNKDGPLPFKVLNGAPGYINLLGNLFT